MTANDQDAARGTREEMADKHVADESQDCGTASDYKRRSFLCGYDAGTARVRELEGALRLTARLNLHTGGVNEWGAAIQAAHDALEGSPSAKSGAPDSTRLIEAPARKAKRPARGK